MVTAEQFQVQYNLVMAKLGEAYINSEKMRAQIKALKEQKTAVEVQYAAFLKESEPKAPSSAPDTSPVADDVND